MSRSSRSLALNGIAVVAGVGFAVGGWWAVQRIIAVDPLAEYKRELDLESLPGVEMRDFVWKVYDDKGRILARAHVDRAEVGRDRSKVELFAVTDGRYWATADEQFAFEATTATYFNDAGKLTGEQKSKVRNASLDLSAKTFTFEPEKGTLTVPGEIVGKLHGGEVKARDLEYLTKDRSMTVYALTWSGMLAQDGDRRRWTFTPLDSKKSKTTIRGAVSVFEGRYRATDGEVIVLADRTEYDRDKDVLTAKGNIEYFGTDANMRCNDVVVFRKERRAVMTGAVDMLIKPKSTPKPVEETIPPLEPIVPAAIAQQNPPAPPTSDERREIEKQIRTGKNVREYPIAVTADRVEYWYEKGKRRAVVTGSPQARQELGANAWRFAWATVVRYDAESERLRLEGGKGRSEVRMLNSLGDDVYAEWIEVSTKEGVDEMDASGLHGEIAVDESELPEGRQTSPPAGGGTGGSGGGGGIRGPIGR
ncbi:MAG: hypothetical protein KIT11_08485 [Fimbriimonadaceae bacterium]|nr:hypothetical protein [Fimbriimonadaceae bacterium]QYK56390.1 MAG: hypothetical protein KF733_02680 [Fimbriimonadaceae bacterium]